MIIKVVSDTHRTHMDLTSLLQGVDLVIHAGDADCYDENTFNTFLNWAIKVAKTTKYGLIYVPGNHDTYISENAEYIRGEFLGTDVHILLNDEARIGGLSIYGSPNSVAYGDRWTAFAGVESELIQKSWNRIPENLDILITHSPPSGILDANFGSKGLRDKVEDTKPRVHIFGHIHHATGIDNNDHTLFINAATVGDGIFEIEYDERQRKVVEGSAKFIKCNP